MAASFGPHFSLQLEGYAFDIDLALFIVNLNETLSYLIRRISVLLKINLDISLPLINTTTSGYLLGAFHILSSGHIKRRSPDDDSSLSINALLTPIAHDLSLDLIGQLQLGFLPASVENRRRTPVGQFKLERERPLTLRYTALEVEYELSLVQENFFFFSFMLDCFDPGLVAFPDSPVLHVHPLRLLFSFDQHEQLVSVIPVLV